MDDMNQDYSRHNQPTPLGAGESFANVNTSTLVAEVEPPPGSGVPNDLDVTCFVNLANYEACGSGNSTRGGNTDSNLGATVSSSEVSLTFL